MAMMRPSNLSHSPSPSASTQGTMDPAAGHSNSVDPFATPRPSRSSSRLRPSTRGTSATYYVSAPNLRYFKSRWVPRVEGGPPRKFKKDAKEKWLWIIPLCGILIGFAIDAFIVYLKIGKTSQHNYCIVLDDDFSSGVLDPHVWTREIEVGGYGNMQFDQTTGDDVNAFIKDGKLHIKPTLQDAALIESSNIINLTADGTCTSVYWANCVSSTNTTNGTINQPARSARLNTKRGATIRYGRVEVTAKISQGDWLWPAIWMMPVSDVYGVWPASGEIDIMESRGNNHSYSGSGNQVVSSSLHWGPDSTQDAYHLTGDEKTALHAEFGDAFHIYGLEWTDKYLFTYIDTRLLQVFYYDFTTPFWPKGNFPATSANGTKYGDPWSQTGRPSTPFDQDFYLILNVAVGARNGWFQDGINGKPWVDASSTAKVDFWKTRDQWYPTWEKNGDMVVDRVQMWQQC